MRIILLLHVHKLPVHHAHRSDPDVHIRAKETEGYCASPGG